MDQNKKIKLIVVVGPTASGKTALAVELAKHYDGEVVSADSMQIYKEMQIATAKPTAEEMQGIVHHLIDFLPPDKSYSVADYVKDAHRIIADISQRGKMPIVAGGTGLYINSLLQNIDFFETKADTEYRNALLEIARQEGEEKLLMMLQKVDPITASRLHANNVNRVIRALEVYKVTGKTMEEQRLKSLEAGEIYETCKIGLTFKDRQKLYDRIHKRVDIMLQNGLVEEAKSVIEKNDLLKTSAQAIGYKELKPYFDGVISLDEAIQNIKLETRHYAKRQLTWFRRDEEIKWFYRDEELNDEKIVKNSIQYVDFSFAI